MFTSKFRLSQTFLAKSSPEHIFQIRIIVRSIHIFRSRKFCEGLYKDLASIDYLKDYLYNWFFMLLEKNWISSSTAFFAFFLSLITQALTQSRLTSSNFPRSSVAFIQSDFNWSPAHFFWNCRAIKGIIFTPEKRLQEFCMHLAMQSVLRVECVRGRYCSTYFWGMPRIVTPGVCIH